MLTNAGHDTVHVRDYGMQAAEDVSVLEQARVEGRVLVSADSDFATLLALQEASHPSFVLFREANAASAEQYANLLLSNLPGLEAELSRGCVAVFRAGRVRVRSLPFSVD
jgi:predicted nuclease of predicted toxin-antitoxin system